MPSSPNSMVWEESFVLPHSPSGDKLGAAPNFSRQFKNPHFRHKARFGEQMLCTQKFFLYRIRLEQWGPNAGFNLIAQYLLRAYSVLRLSAHQEMQRIVENHRLKSWRKPKDHFTNPLIWKVSKLRPREENWPTNPGRWSAAETGWDSDSRLSVQ